MSYYSDPTGTYFVGSAVLREAVYGSKSHKRCYHESLLCARKRAKTDIVVEFEKQWAIDNNRPACKICCTSPAKGGGKAKGGEGGKGSKDGKGNGKGKDGGGKGAEDDKGGKGGKDGKGDKGGVSSQHSSDDGTDRVTEAHGFGSDHSCWTQPN